MGMVFWDLMDPLGNMCLNRLPPGSYRIAGLNRGADFFCNATSNLRFRHPTEGVFFFKNCAAIPSKP